MFRFKYVLAISCILLKIFLSPVPGFTQQTIPRILSVCPEYGSNDIDTQTEISVVFNTAMDKKSAEKNFSIFPEVKGRFKWEGNTVKFKPDSPLLPSTSYFVSFSPDVRTVDGIPFPITYFNTPAEGVFVNPEGKISIVSIKGNKKEIAVEAHNPAWYRDNRSIIYDKAGKIWQVNSDGSSEKELTFDEEMYKASYPACNPLADIVAFIGTNDAGSANIFTVDTKTETIQQLTAFYEPIGIENLKWSPDGLYLAFLRNGQIWIMNRDGKDMRKLTTDELTCKENFAWSPGGTKIAFSGEENVWIGDIYSSELRKMSFDNPKIGPLDWSADNKIAFVQQGLVVMNADGSEEVKIKTAAQKPVWINDGEFLSFILPLFNNDNKSQVWIMSSDGRKKKKIAVINSRDSDISWSRNVGFWNLFSP